MFVGLFAFCYSSSDRLRYYFSRKLVLSGQTYFREKEGMNQRERRWKKMLVNTLGKLLDSKLACRAFLGAQW